MPLFERRAASHAMNFMPDEHECRDVDVASFLEASMQHTQDFCKGENARFDAVARKIE